MKKNIFITVCLICLMHFCLSEKANCSNYVKNQILIKTRTPLNEKINSSASQSSASLTTLSYSLPGLNKYKIKKKSSIGPLPVSKAPKHIRVHSSIKSRSQNIYKIVFDEEVDIHKIISELKKDDEIIWAEPNHIIKAQYIPNDTFYSSQWNLQAINMEQTWDFSLGSSSVVIAVIDTGVDWTHPDLANNIWNNENETLNNIDDDGNGKVDDIRGWDFVETFYNNAYPGEDYHTQDNDPVDFNGHGTHCAGIIAAAGNNSTGISGTAPLCKIMPVRAGYTNILGEGYFELASLANAVYYAVDMGAQVINLSVGGIASGYSVLHSSIEYAVNNNVVVVAAAGNEGLNLDQVDYVPVKLNGVIGVGAVDLNNENTSYSNFGESVDIAAPGGTLINNDTYKILSTYPSDSYAYEVGTSMAAPHVAGVAGLILSIQPYYTASKISNILIETATDRGSTGKDPYYGHGLLNALKAVIYSSLDFKKSQNDDYITIIDGDYLSSDQPIVIKINDGVILLENSIAVDITTDTETKSYSYPEDSFITFSNSTNTITLNLPGITLPDNQDITFKVTCTDSLNNKFEKELSIKMNSSEQLKIFGPNGENSPVYNAPNPFNPDSEETAVCYQINKTCKVTFYIYSLNLQLVKKEEKSIPAGYYEEVWDGRDMAGDTVPNGVYIFILKAEADGKTIIKRNKIAVLR